MTTVTTKNPQDAKLLESGKIITDSLGIGRAPDYPLHVAGDQIVRFEMGAKGVFSLGPEGEVFVDKPNVGGGRFIIRANGNVGINQPDPKATLDVNGTIRATTFDFTGELSVKGMKTTRSAPDYGRLRSVFVDPQTGTLYYHG